VRHVIDRKSVLKLAMTALVGAAFGVHSRPARAAETLRLPAPRRAWDMVEFNYPGTGRTFPGLAVRLPETAGAGSAQCAASARTWAVCSATRPITRT